MLDAPTAIDSPDVRQLLERIAAAVEARVDDREGLDAAAAAREKFSGLVRACLKKL